MCFSPCHRASTLDMQVSQTAELELNYDNCSTLCIYVTRSAKADPTQSHAHFLNSCLFYNLLISFSNGLQPYKTATTERSICTASIVKITEITGAYYYGCYEQNDKRVEIYTMYFTHCIQCIQYTVNLGLCDCVGFSQIW